MITNKLQRAQDAVEEKLRASGRPMKAVELFDSIDEEGVRDIDLREAVWLLIGKGTIHLNWERQLVLAEDFESEAVAG